MRHRSHSIPVSKLQRRLGRLVGRLRRLDGELADLAGGLGHRADEPLAEDLRGTIDVVRTDLLSDALETLAALTELDAPRALEPGLETAASIVSG